MSGRTRVVGALVVVALGLSACGSSANAPSGAGAAQAASAAGAVEAPSTAPSIASPTAAVQGGSPAPAGPTVGAPDAAAGVTAISAGAAAAEKAKLQAAEAESAVAWEAPTLAALKEIDPRLVADRAAAVARVRASCGEISGLFSPRAIKLVRARFSDKKFKLTEDMAAAIYDVVLYKACPEIS